MKKLILSIVAVATLAVTSTFANVEMDLNWYMSPAKAFDSKNSDVTSNITTPIFFGLEDSFGFFFGKGKKHFDAGLGLGLGFDIFTDPVVKIDSKKNTMDATGADFFFQIGPVFRFTFSKKHSLSVTPGLRWNLGVIWQDENKVKKDDIIYDINVLTELDFFTQVAYKFWFVNTANSGFHFGLNTGLQFNWLMGGTNYYLKGSASKAAKTYNGPKTVGQEMKNGFDTKFFLGLCFNFGSRGFDRN